MIKNFLVRYAGSINGRSFQSMKLASTFARRVQGMIMMRSVPSENPDYIDNRRVGWSLLRA